MIQHDPYAAMIGGEMTPKHHAPTAHGQASMGEQNNNRGGVEGYAQNSCASVTELAQQNAAGVGFPARAGIKPGPWLHRANVRPC